MTVEQVEEAAGKTTVSGGKTSGAAMFAADDGAAAASQYADNIILKDYFVGSHWTSGEDVVIPFYMFCYGNYGEEYFVEIYDEYQNNLLGSTSGTFPNQVGQTNLNVTWSAGLYPPEGGKFWVNFYSTYDHTYADTVYAFYIDPPAEPEPDVQTGWVQYGDKWSYYKYDGSCYVDEWAEIDGYWYYFDSIGFMQTGWTDVQGNTYFFDASGHMVTGWQWIDGYCYYFDASGAMARNQWIDGSYVGNDGAWVQAQWIQDENGWWYCHEDGSCTYSSFETINGGVFYFNDFGYMVTGWQWINGSYYYFDGSGYMQTGWQWIDGSYYYFDASGYMVTGWQWIDGNCYYFDASGAMATNQWIDGSYVGNDGAWVQAQWIQDDNGWWYCHEDGSCTYSSFETINGGVFYFDGSGYMVTGWQWINGSYYYFDGSGYMQTGWQWIDGSYYYFDASGYMMTGWQWIDGNCYYFDASGAMATNQWIDGSYVGDDGAWVSVYAESIVYSASAEPEAAEPEAAEPEAAEPEAAEPEAAEPEAAEAVLAEPEAAEPEAAEPEAAEPVPAEPETEPVSAEPETVEMDDKGNWEFNETGWKFLREDGTYAVCEWVHFEGKLYYLDADGYRVTGEQVIDGVLFTFDENGVRI